MLHKSNRQLFNLNIKTPKKDAARKRIQFSHPAILFLKLIICKFKFANFFFFNLHLKLL